MRRLIMPCLVALLLMLAAGQAFATHYENLIFAANCTEWTAEVELRIYYLVHEADLAYEVAIEDMDGNVLLSTSGTTTVVDDDLDRYASVLLGDSWDNVTDETIELFGSFIVRANFTIIGTDENPASDPLREETVLVECAVVPNDQVSWGAVKSEYR